MQSCSQGDIYEIYLGNTDEISLGNTDEIYLGNTDEIYVLLVPREGLQSKKRVTKLVLAIILVFTGISETAILTYSVNIIQKYYSENN